MMTYDTLQTVVRLSNLFWWYLNFALVIIALIMVIALIELTRIVTKRIAVDVIDITHRVIYQLGMDLISLRAASQNATLDAEQRRLEIEAIGVKLLAGDE